MQSRTRYGPPSTSSAFPPSGPHRARLVASRRRHWARHKLIPSAMPRSCAARRRRPLGSLRRSDLLGSVVALRCAFPGRGRAPAMPSSRNQVRRPRSGRGGSAGVAGGKPTRAGDASAQQRVADRAHGRPARPSRPLLHVLRPEDAATAIGVAWTRVRFPLPLSRSHRRCPAHHRGLRWPTGRRKDPRRSGRVSGVTILRGECLTCRSRFAVRTFRSRSTSSGPVRPGCISCATAAAIVTGMDEMTRTDSELRAALAGFVRRSRRRTAPGRGRRARDRSTIRTAVDARGGSPTVASRPTRDAEGAASRSSRAAAGIEARS